MTTDIAPSELIALYSETGEYWDAQNEDDRAAFQWDREDRDRVTKIVIGTPPIGDEAKEIQVEIPVDLAERFPNLTHLYLWQISNLETLPALPAGLQCLDVRGCRNLNDWGGMPTDLPELDTLVLDGTKLPNLQTTNFPKLRDLSLRKCEQISDSWFKEVLKSNSQIELVDGSGLQQLTTLQVAELPRKLKDLRLNSCERLKAVIGEEPNKWPPELRRLELRRARKLATLPDFPRKLDYIDLAYTNSLKALPVMPEYDGAAETIQHPRTLFLFESGVPLEAYLLGETDDTNVAERVLADREESRAGEDTDHELKVILLGNGRSGKSSFARRWVHNEFKEDEETTHGVRLWEKDFDFTPVDDPHGKVRLNIWDFAGQDLYHSTHRLFLQRKAIFLVFHTEHPPGSDDDSDRKEEAKIEEEGDILRPAQYWIDQVRSLGKIPGPVEKEPPVLVVRSKSDRDGEREVASRVDLPDDFSQVVFSAKSGIGLAQIEDWIADQTSELLGTRQQRSLPAPVKRVKDSLNEKIVENNKAYWDQEDEQKPVQSPHPTISLSDFAALVKEHCTELYADDPKLLLDRFHKSGFLYYDERYLPNNIILDQRWAIHGIYTLTSRQSEFGVRLNLERNDGIFTAEWLAEKSWDQAGYDTEAQKLFLQFMLACGMCFKLLNEDESASGQVVYAAPGFFQSREMAAKRHPELEFKTADEWARFGLAGATESDMRSIIANLGADWSRSMQAWRWGCRVRSGITGAYCWFDWARPDDGKHYSHPLNIWFTGPNDPVFEENIRERVSQLFNRGSGNEPALFEKHWPQIDKHILARHSIRSQAIDEFEHGYPSAVPSREEAKGVSISFSYADSDSKKKENGRIGEVPRRLGEKLEKWVKENHLEHKILIYGSTTEEDRLSNFIGALASGDLCLVFWSKKYWYSKFCMTEMMKIFENAPHQRFEFNRIIVWAFDGHRLREDCSGLEVQSSKWENEWLNRANDELDEIRKSADGDRRHETKLLKRRGAVGEWYQFVNDATNFEAFVEALVEYRFTNSLSCPIDDFEVEDTTNQLFQTVMERLDDPIVKVDLALQRLQKGRDEDAVVLLLDALAAKPDKQRDIKARVLSPGNDAIPEELRQAAIKYLKLDEEEGS